MSIRIGRQIVAGSGGSGGSGECNINVDNTTIIQNQDGTISSIASLNQNQEPIKFWTGTLAEYEQLTPDENTLYNIIDDEFEEQDKFFGFNLFDTKLSDHVIEDKGWALQGTYVNRLDYPTFYDVCLKNIKIMNLWTVSSIMCYHKYNHIYLQVQMVNILHYQM